MDNPYILLKKHKNKLMPHQYATIKGQLRAGDIKGALKGLHKLIKS